MFKNARTTRHYAYSNVRTPDLETGLGELRELICHYVTAYTRVTPSMLHSQLYFEREEVFYAVFGN
jgi:hypothetical protein